MAMTLRLSDEQDRALTLLARAQGSSKHEAAVRAIVAQAARTLADVHVAELAAHHLPEVRAANRRVRQARALGSRG